MNHLVDPSEGSHCEILDVPVAVVGSGVAGLSVAIEAAQTTDVAVFTKRAVTDSSTEWAQGGIASVQSAEDSYELHADDTLRVGCGLCDEALVQRVVGEGREALQRLIDWGARFDRTAGGELALGLEGGHRRDRVVHAMGDQTGREVQRTLVERARRDPRIQLVDGAFVVDILRDDEGRACGLLAWRNGAFLRVRAKVVVIATGGCGHVYRETTNPAVATGDGHAMLFRVGATLRGMEFVQFHPTTLYIAGSSRILISEAARGEGAVLRDRNGVAFLDQIHPQGSLAPRDFVSRAVLDRMVETEDTHVYLDLTHLDSSFVRERFPRIGAACRSFGFDVTKDPIPVAPAAHYMIGGVLVDEVGRTNVPGLLAAGEVTYSGLHGANRLASNSLLEGLVLGRATGRTATEQAEHQHAPRDPVWEQPSTTTRPDPAFNSPDLLNSLQSLMWRQVGLLRDGARLDEASRRLDEWRRIAAQFGGRESQFWELSNLLLVGSLIANAARAREESRGTHYRLDHIERDDTAWCADLDIQRGDGGTVQITQRRRDAASDRLETT